MKTTFMLTILLLCQSAMSGINSDLAREVCSWISVTDYPDAFKECRKVTAQGDFKALAVGTCSASVFSVYDRVSCLGNIRNKRFHPNAVQICNKMVDRSSRDWPNAMKCLSNVMEKSYTDEEIDTCEHDYYKENCYYKNGTPLSATPGF